MRVFVTGATGNIGTAVVAELIGAGHQVLGLCRSTEKEAALRAAGAQAHRGSIDDPASLMAGAADADGVIHLAFNHDFSRFAASCEEDRGVIAALASALQGSDRPLIVTSGTAIVAGVAGQPARETDAIVSTHPRAASEQAAAAAAANGTNVSVVRLAQVHDPVSQGLVTPLTALYRQRGRCDYIGDGTQRWPAVPLADAARLYRLAIERAQPGANYHAVAEEGITLREIAHVLGERLGLPVGSITAAQAQEHFGWLARFACHDLPASSEQTRHQLGWVPTGPRLVDDLRRLVLDHG
ncbi:SDR family oxidoreductase [Stenotrophomonas sp. 24(2023)]|uniref:SDR family oxidoreductase n=1 Tax=Stenotrophomonas sp. 24(2023) TaxID=3068324 RepID=UPI0027E03CC9|nr:SDR family oxidoreductase [Stenotrophomonas sp. 24(2023)]WMJ70320.1 SDR family oxidoreductase [Stenotrophomonas sp. 24(2023)]